MADLEKLLLQAAGRTGGASGRNNNNNSSNNNNSRRWERSYSDGSSGSDDEDPKYRKSSQVPLKKRDKRGGSWDEEDEDDDGDDSDSAPSVGSDLYKDDADREALEKMSELDREMILADRSTKIDDYKLKKMARASSSKVDLKRKESSPPPSVNRSRMSTRAAESKTAAKNALNELRAKRMRQQEPDGRKDRLRSMAGEGGFGGRDSTQSKYRAIGMPSSPPSDGSDGERGDNDDKKLDDDLLEDLSPSRLGVMKFEDIKDITIRRSKLVKWFMEPFFEELIAGCFVRLGVGKTRSGPRYKLCLVRNVDATDSAKHYKLENYTTYKWLNCVWGNESSAARWQMAMVSDSPPLEDEFREWKYEVEKNGGRMPSRQEVLNKKSEIQKISNYVYSAATVKQMLQEKKMASIRPVNVAAEKDRLRKELEGAKSRRDGAAEARITAKLKELEDMSRQVKKVDEKAFRLSEMNKKNRAENFKNASELKPVNTSLKAGEAGYDPFSRRWTRSSNYYLSKSGGDGNSAAENGSGEKPAADNGVANGMDAGLAATAAALEAAAGAGKLIDTSAPVDQGTVLHHLHNFDIPISLAPFQKFGGPQGGPAGFLARKQKTEATIGYKVPDIDDRRHPLTLTVSDYKRRRGLL